MGFPLCEVAQAFLDFPFPLPLPFLCGGSDFWGRLGCLGVSWARLAGGGAGMALEILGRSIRMDLHAAMREFMEGHGIHLKCLDLVMS